MNPLITRRLNPAELWPWGLWSLFSLGILLLFVAYPIGVLTWNALLDAQGRLSFNGFATVLSEAQYLEAIRNTVVLGLVVTCTSTLVGVPLAYVMARYDFPLKPVVVSVHL